MKRKHTAHHENHERWLVSYADFITLLFAFFVVMFATAQKDKTKAKLVAESVREALQHGQLSTTITGIIRQMKVTPDGKGDSRVNPDVPPPARPQAKLPPVPSKDLEKTLATLHELLKKELAEGKVALKLDQRGLVVSMREVTFFASGDDAVNPASLPIVQKIAQVIGTVPNPVRLEGHTDSVPIHNSRFRSNWELSAARSIALLEILRGQCGVPADKLSVAGFAENAPVDTNDTPEGRSHNRRVDLVVLSAEAVRGEPPPKPAEPLAQAKPPN
ncbi:MAG TPA: flagellar motor protein MotB [Bryobacteraceae bacterium]|jgi:chemotaxis protein MotB